MSRESYKNRKIAIYYIHPELRIGLGIAVSVRKRQRAGREQGRAPREHHQRRSRWEPEMTSSKLSPRKVCRSHERSFCASHSLLRGKYNPRSLHATLAQRMVQRGT